MNLTLKPCEQYPSEDYSFHVTNIGEDKETGDELFDISGNVRCEICPFRVECAQKVIDIVAGEFDIEKEEFFIDKTNYN